MIQDTPSQNFSWYQSFQDVSREHDFESMQIEGKLPTDLNGTLYRVGPGLFSSFGKRYKHWFDGDGAISAVCFSNGTAKGAVKIVKSKGLSQEQSAGKPLYGGYGTVPPGIRAKLEARVKNVANTSVLPWNNRLFALMEAGLPTEISKDDLSTLGESQMEGMIPQAFSAHPHRVVSRKTIYNFGVRYGRTTFLDLFELADSGVARMLGSVPLDGPSFVHDFIATEKHLLFFVPPLRLRIIPMLLGLGSYSENLKWRPSLGTEVLIIPIDTPAEVIRFTTDPFYQWHFSNAFEREKEIVVDLVRYPNFNSNQRLSELTHGQCDQPFDGTFYRIVVEPAKERVYSEERWSQVCEFPRVTPQVEGKSYRYSYVTSYTDPNHPCGLQGVITKLDVESGAITQMRYENESITSEPIFVSKKGAKEEDAGYLLSLIYDPDKHQSYIGVLDAQDFEKGPLCKVWFDHHVPPTFHGAWDL